MRTLAELQAECAGLGLAVPTNGRLKKDNYITALRDYHWRKSHPDTPVPPQTIPMLLSTWGDLDEEQAEQIEEDDSGWIVQPKLDGVRVLLHVEEQCVRITSRHVSEVTFRLGELQNNVPHLVAGLAKIDRTILDGELLCPVTMLNTGSSVTAHPLQAAVAVLATSAANARHIQERYHAHLRLHVFDILRYRGTDVTGRSLYERLDLVHRAVANADNPHLNIVPSFVIGKAVVHRQLIETGNEGSVWKKADQHYEPGRRVKHWIKRKRGLELEAFVTGFKPGAPENSHAHLVGALEFSTRQADGTTRPVAWVCGLDDAERQAMTRYDAAGAVQLNPNFLGRRARIVGQDFAVKSNRLRHARVLRWLDP